MFSITTEQRMTILRMAIDLKTYENEHRSITDIYKELIKCLKETEND